MIHIVRQNHGDLQHILKPFHNPGISGHTAAEHYLFLQTDSGKLNDQELRDYLNVKRNPSKTPAARITQGAYCCYTH